MELLLGYSRVKTQIIVEYDSGAYNKALDVIPRHLAQIAGIDCTAYR